MSRALTALVLVLTGCLSLAKAVACQKALWLLVGAPAVALGLWLADLRFSPAAAMRWLARWAHERALDMEAIGAICREIPAEFRARRKELHADR